MIRLAKMSKYYGKGKSKAVSVFEVIFNPLMPIAIFWGALDITVFSGIVSSDIQGGSHAQIVGITGLFMLVHMMPVWIYLVGIITSSLRAAHTHYMITDKGIYIQTGIISITSEMKPFTDLSHVSIHQGLFDRLFGCGDVITVCNHHSTISDYSTTQTSSSHDHHGMNIENITDFEEVFKLIKEYQDAIYSDTMYPNDLRPSENHGYNTRYVGR